MAVQSKQLATFQAEVHQVSSRKLQSLDREFRLVLITEDPSVMNLGVIAPDVLVKVEVSTDA